MKIIAYIAFLSIHFTVISQKKWNVTLIVTDTDSTREVIKSYATKDTSGVRDYVAKKLFSIRKKNHPLAGIEQVERDTINKKLIYYLYKGPLFEKLTIRVLSEQKQLIKRVPGINERLLAQVELSSVEIAEVQLKLLQYLENNGYPFAKVYFTDIQLDTHSPSAQLKIETGPEVKWHTIHLKGDPKIRKSFIQTYLGIREGDLYSEKLFRQITSKIDQLVYLNNEQAPQIAFSSEGAELYLYLKNSPSSSANGILGIQPNEAGKVTFTGDIQLRLMNLLKSGEQMDLSWKSLQAGTQQLDIGINYPFLFKSNFGVEGNFHLYKRDSSFLEIQAQAGIRYYIGKGSFIRGFYRYEGSNVLSGADNNPNFSTSETVRTNFYGIGIIRKKVDYLPNPTRGLNLESNISFGMRKAFPIDSTDIVRQTSSTTYKFDLAIEYFIPLGKRHTIRLANLSRFYIADTIYVNEQIRFGGLNTQRGFDEESLFATTFSRFTLEYRFLLDKNSHLFAFFDQSIYENTSRDYYKDTPYGFGAGLAFGTKVGTFSISYALGSQFGNPIQLRDGKIHFGYVAFF